MISRLNLKPPHHRRSRGFPTIIPARVLAQFAPSKQINIGAIGVGRISRGHDMPAILEVDTARIVAVCDLSSDRVIQGKQYVNDFYTKKNGKPYKGFTLGYASYHELLANKEHRRRSHLHPRSPARPRRSRRSPRRQRRLPPEARLAHHRRRPLPLRRRPIDRPHPPDRQPAALMEAVPRACELVRNGRIGEVQHVEIGLPGDLQAGPPAYARPQRLQVRRMAGSTPDVYYTSTASCLSKDSIAPDGFAWSSSAPA